MYILTWIQTASAQVFKYLIILAHLEPILREGWDNTSQMPYKASFSHIHSSSMQPGSFFLCVCNMVQTAFPTQANVKQTLTNLPLNSSHHQIREREEKKSFSLAQLCSKHVVAQMFFYLIVTANL